MSSVEGVTGILFPTPGGGDNGGTDPDGGDNGGTVEPGDGSGSTGGSGSSGGTGGDTGSGGSDSGSGGTGSGGSSGSGADSGGSGGSSGGTSAVSPASSSAPATRSLGTDAPQVSLAEAEAAELRFRAENPTSSAEPRRTVIEQLFQIDPGSGISALFPEPQTEPTETERTNRFLDTLSEVRAFESGFEAKDSDPVFVPGQTSTADNGSRNAGSAAPTERTDQPAEASRKSVATA